MPRLTKQPAKTPAKPKVTPEPTKPVEYLIPAAQVVPFTGREVPAIPKGFKHKALTREEVETRFHLAFELIGGVERFALWADQNPTEYYRMYAKLLPESKQQASGPTELKISLGDGFGIPQSPLDDIEVRDESVVNARYLPKNGS